MKLNLAAGQTISHYRILEKAYEERDSWMDYLGLDPRLDSLRADPRFAGLLRPMNLGSDSGGSNNYGQQTSKGP